ncbi:MAG: hypothetical protein EB117_17860, partial [Betaproteobacteria bacterium]|nr:hypothetical protein [Betaproteobacteria bacterium]
MNLIETTVIGTVSAIVGGAVAWMTRGKFQADSLQVKQAQAVLAMWQATAEAQNKELTQLRNEVVALRQVIVNGDFFCLMQGKGDPRRSKEDIRPEHNNARYLDSIVNTAVEWFSPYAKNLLLLGYGNHETSIIHHQETDILQRFASTLNYATGSAVEVGGYGGTLDIRVMHDHLRGVNFVVHYYHGAGGGGPVTKGVIQDQRLLAATEGYDLTWMGHVHELYYHQNMIHRYDRQTKTLIQKPVHQLRTA